MNCVRFWKTRSWLIWRLSGNN